MCMKNIYLLLNLFQAAQEAEAELEAEEADIDLTLDLSEFRLPAPKELSESDRDGLVRTSMSRIWDGANDLAPHGHSPPSAEPATDLWMLLIVRLVTRVSEPPPDDPPEDDEGGPNGKEDETSYIVAHQDRLRQTLCEYIVDDFTGR